MEVALLCKCIFSSHSTGLLGALGNAPTVYFMVFSVVIAVSPGSLLNDCELLQRKFANVELNSAKLLPKHI